MNKYLCTPAPPFLPLTPNHTSTVRKAAGLLLSSTAGVSSLSEELHVWVVRGTKTDMASQKGADEKKENRVQLRRRINLVPAISFIVGTMVGSGIFITPKGVHINTGSVGFSLLVWVLCGLLSMFGILQNLLPVMGLTIHYWAKEYVTRRTARCFLIITPEKNTRA